MGILPCPAAEHDCSRLHSCRRKGKIRLICLSFHTTAFLPKSVCASRIHLSNILKKLVLSVRKESFRCGGSDASAGIEKESRPHNTRKTMGRETATMPKTAHEAVSGVHTGHPIPSGRQRRQMQLKSIPSDTAGSELQLLISESLCWQICTENQVLLHRICQRSSKTGSEVCV